ncbi:MAG: ribosomal protein S18-alanine N-acetyltransferase [Proteobacteria bacterium]|nr:ribosomal protein S18-alanine N-acetyltransferase [Pseudomonadota bacterium]
MVGFTTLGKAALNCTLRAAVPDDANNLATIDLAASDHPWTEAQYISISAAVPKASSGSFSETVQLLEMDGEICGFVVYSLVMDEGSIHNIAVSPAWQGQGMARILLREALKVLRNHGALRCLLEVRISNTVARGLYDSFEFQQDGIRKKYYPSPNGREDALLMSKSL